MNNNITVHKREQHVTLIQEGNVIHLSLSDADHLRETLGFLLETGISNQTEEIRSESVKSERAHQP
jgi:hypothetical protein